MASHKDTSGRSRRHLALWLTLLLLSGCSLPPLASQPMPTAPPFGTEPAGRPAQSAPSNAATPLAPSTPSPPATPTVAESPLVFETIERWDYSDFYQRQRSAPGQAFLVTSPEEAAPLAERVSPAAQAALRQLDYGRYFVIAIFRGTMASAGYDLIIERVGRRGEEVVAYVQAFAPGPDYVFAAVETHPYHIVKVERAGKRVTGADLVVEVQNRSGLAPRGVLQPTATPAN